MLIETITLLYFQWELDVHFFTGDTLFLPGTRDNVTNLTVIHFYNTFALTLINVFVLSNNLFSQFYHCCFSAFIRSLFSCNPTHILSTEESKTQEVSEKKRFFL